MLKLNSYFDINELGSKEMAFAHVRGTFISAWSNPQVDQKFNIFLRWIFHRCKKRKIQFIGRAVPSL